MIFNLQSLKISHKLSYALLFFSALAFISAALAFWGYQKLSQSYQKLAIESLPRVVVMHALAENSAQLTLQTLKLLDVDNQEGFLKAREDITQQIMRSEQLVKEVERISQSGSQYNQKIETLIQQIVKNAEQQISLLESRVQLLPEVLASEKSARDAVRQAKYEVKSLNAGISAQLFDSKTSVISNIALVSKYNAATRLQSNFAIIEGILVRILQLNTPRSVGIAKDEYTARIHQSTNLIFQLTETERQVFAQYLGSLLSISSGEQNIFAQVEKLLIAEEKIENIGIANSDLLMDLEAQLIAATEAAEMTVREDYDQASRVKYISQAILAIVVFVSIVGPIAVIVLFVKPSITERLKRLTANTHLIADGNLDVKVDIQGSDELYELSMALENFRKMLIVKQVSEQTLLEIQQRYDVAVQGSSVGLWDWDVVSNTLYWSPRFKEIIGISDKDFIPHFKEFESRLHTEDREAVLKAIEIHLQQQVPYKVEYRLRHNSGHYVWVHARGQAIWDSQDNPVRMAGSVDDISDKKASEEALKESRAFLRLIMENNPDFLFIKDKNFKIVEANPAFVSVYPQDQQDKIIGYTTLEAYSSKEADSFLEKDRLAFAEGYSDTIETINFPDGQVRTLYTQKIRFENSLGEPFVLGIGRDVTERETLIQKLTETNKELERFAYIASHDLQEPLRMVKSFTELLAQQYADKLDEVGKQYIEYASQGAVNMQNLVSDLLEYARTGNETSIKEEINVESALHFVEKNLQFDIEKLSVVITHESLPVVNGNSVQFSRLLQNLIGNAIKYRKQDVAPAIHIKAEDKQSEWLFSVEDNGIGMRPEYCEKIFIPFKRLHSRADYPGSGIGLAICQKIIDGFNGKIWAESKLGEGSVFYFTIPK